MTADLLIRDVRVGPGGPRADVAVTGGRVTAVRPPGESEPANEIADGEGATLLRGLHDRHVHLRHWALRRGAVDLQGVTDVRQAVAALGDAARVADGPVLSFGAAEVLVRELAADPGALVDVRVPLLVQALDLHTSWVNEAAARDAGVGTAAALLRESASFTAARRISASVDVGTTLLAALHDAAALGVVGVLDLEMADNVRDWPRRAADGPLPLRIDCSIPQDHLASAIDGGFVTGQALDDAGLLHVGPVKTFVDGSLGSATALCSAAYPDAHGDHGRQEIGAAELTELIREAGTHGLSVAAHAIGDVAVGVALDAFAAAGHSGRIEHAQLVRRSDLARFAALGVVAGVQPAHLLDDRDLAQRLWAGQPGVAYAYESLRAAGAVLEFGSDAPVSPLDPWRGIRAAVTRTGDERSAWHPDQRLTLAQALDASTGGRATPRVGDVADLVLVAGRSFDSPPVPDPTELDDVRVQATMLAGRWTHRA